MIVVRFTIESRPEHTERVRALLTNVAVASQDVEGVESFDIGQDLTDANTFIATEVFRDRDALERLESLPEVAAAMEELGGELAGYPEATIFDVASSEPYA